MHPGAHQKRITRELRGARTEKRAVLAGDALLAGYADVPVVWGRPPNRGGRGSLA